ncbi:MAG: 30S ribosome-binding factor RbfA [Gammaproteobacteria bacterium]
MTSKARQQRVESELQRVVAELIAREIKDPRVGMVTITAVQVAPDMGSARVLFVPFGDRHTPDEVGEGLRRAAGFLRGEVGRRLGLRHAPRLDFEFDESIERANRLTRLIDHAVRGEGDDPSSGGSSR